MTPHNAPEIEIRALPTESVQLVPTPQHLVPLRAPAEAWGMVVLAVRTTDAAGAPVRFVGDAPAPDPAHTDIADLMVGLWLPAPPPATLHTGDVVVRLHAPADDDPNLTDVEVLAAMHGEWRILQRWHAVDARWPHEIAMSVLTRMRYLADIALSDAQWATLTGPIAATMPDWLADGLGIAGEAAGSAPPRPAHDALAEMIEAGLVDVGEQVMWDGHTVTVGTCGVLSHGTHAFAISTVTALATNVSGCTVNGWYLWRRARDGRLLADLRTELATR